MSGLATTGASRRPLDMSLDAALVVLVVLLTLILPAAVYGYLSWRQFDYFRLTYFIPFEEIRAALATADPGRILRQPLIQFNMTSGHMLANMYSLTLLQLLLSAGLGVVVGLVFVSYLRLRDLCALTPGRGTSAAAASGAGLFATIAASSTGLLGCCGSAAAGGVLALAGLSSTMAAQISGASPVVQFVLIALFVWQLARLRRRIRSLRPVTA